MGQAVRFAEIDTATAKTLTAPEAIAYHYDNDTAFFSLWLDPTLSYSCARFKDPLTGTAIAKTLADAQREKIRHHLDAVGLPKGGRLIDIGSGWGAVLFEAVRRDPDATALGLTLSNDQHAHVNGANVPGVRCELRDVFAFESDTLFDGAVSIGAFEHFARPEMDRAAKLHVYGQFFARIADLLPPGGRFSLQTIVWGGVDPARAKTLLPETVFPQSDLPFIEEIVMASAQTFHLAYLENDPDEYADTLSAWIKALRAERGRIEADWSPEQYAFFERYLRRSRLSFNKRYTSLARLVLQKRG
ncbi:MAG: class I SAM-dependent methyltransferase [Pseudomonadota bacterium]